MHHLIVDTCVWFDLAVSEFSLVAKLARLIAADKVTIVLPELIRNEWNHCKKKIVEQITRGITDARRSAITLTTLLDETDLTEISDRISSVDPVSMGADIGTQRIQAIEKILDSDSTIWVPASSQTNASAIAHALQKKAPFRQRNSMADALIFLSAVEWVNANKPERSVFVTHNTKDFSDEKRGDEDRDFKERLAPDLQVLADKNRLEYGIIVGRVLNDIEQSVATEEEIERGETVVERKRVLDDLRSGPIADALEQQKKFQDMMSGPVADALEQQKKFQDMISGPAADALEQQKKFQNMMSGPVADALEQQKKFQDMISGPAADALEQQKKFQDMMSGRAIADALEQWKKIQDMISGPVADALEQQKKIQDMISGPAIADALKQQKKLQDMISGRGIDSDETNEEDDSIDDEADDGEGASDDGLPGKE